MTTLDPRARFVCGCPKVANTTKSIVSPLLAVSELRKYHTIVSPRFCRLSTQNLISKSALASHGERYGSPRWRLWVGHSLLGLGMWSVDCSLIDGGVGSRGNGMRLLMILRKRRKGKKDSTYHNISFSTIDCCFVTSAFILFYLTLTPLHSTSLFPPFSHFSLFSVCSVVVALWLLYISVHKVVYQRPHTVNPSPP